MGSLVLLRLGIASLVVVLSGKIRGVPLFLVLYYLLLRVLHYSWLKLNYSPYIPILTNQTIKGLY